MINQLSKEKGLYSQIPGGYESTFNLACCKAKMDTTAEEQVHTMKITRYVAKIYLQTSIHLVI